MSVVIRAVGSALPARAVPNDDLPAALETSDEWIKSRTGIAQRYIAADDETTSSLAIAAARSALDSAGLKADDIDGIIVATTTPDLTFPAVATMVQRELGVPAGTLAFDVQAVCAGFIYAVGVADGLLQAGRMRRAIVIGSETMTRILNWEDRTILAEGPALLTLKEGFEGAMDHTNIEVGIVGEDKVFKVLRVPKVILVEQLLLLHLQIQAVMNQILPEIFLFSII